MEVLKIYLTFLQRARATIVIKLPGMPNNINNKQQTVAKFSKAGKFKF